MKKIILILLVSITWGMAFDFSAGRVNITVREPVITLDTSTFSDSLSKQKPSVEHKKSDNPILVIQGDSKDMYSVDFSPDASMIVSAGKENYIKLWDTESGKLIKKFPINSRRDEQVIFHPNGKYIAFEDYLNKKTIIRMIDIKTGETIQIFSGIAPFVFSSDHRFISYTVNKTRHGAMRRNYQVIIEEINTGIKRKNLENHVRKISDIAFNPKNYNILSAGFSGAQPFNGYRGNIGISDIRTGKLLYAFNDEKDVGANAVAYSHDGNLIATTAYAYYFKLYNANNGKFIKKLKLKKKIWDVEFNDDGSFIAVIAGQSKNYGSSVVLLNTKLGQVFKKLYLYANEDRSTMKSLSFSRNSNLLMLVADKKIYVWDTSRFNQKLAKKIYNSISKSDYIALYEFTKKFYNKFDIVQKAYRDIYDAVTQKDTLEAYEWYVSVFKKTIDNGELIKDHIDGYYWYQKHYDPNAAGELGIISKKLNTLRQTKYAKEYEAVKKENNLAIYDYYASSHTEPKADNLQDAVNAVYKLAFVKAKEINTISAYNTFIFAYPYADEVKEANKLAYDLEKIMYTDIGVMGFFGKEEKMNKQARKLLIKAKKILDETVPDGNMANYNDIGVYMVVERMYRLAQEEFADTDVVLTLMESDKLKRFKNKFKRKLKERTHGRDRIVSNSIEDEWELRGEAVYYIFNEAPNIDMGMKQFYKGEREKASLFIKNANKIAQKEFDDKNRRVKEKREAFEKLYQKQVNEYKPEPVKVESLDLGSFDRQGSSTYTTLNKQQIKEKVLSVIKNGSNDLGYPMGLMPGKMASGKDAEDIAEYISNGLKGLAPTAFETCCASCHGKDGKGMNGMSPNLLAYVTQSIPNYKKSNDTVAINQNTISHKTTTKQNPKKIDLSNTTIDASVTYKEEEQSVRFMVKATNTGSDAKGGVSLSFATLQNKSVVKDMSSNGFSSVDVYGAGSRIWHGIKKKLVNADYLLVEGWSKVWKSGETKTMSFSIDKSILPYQAFNARAIIIKGKKEFLSPKFGPKDQQGYPVKSLVLNLSNSNTKVQNSNPVNQKNYPTPNDKHQAYYRQQTVIPVIVSGKDVGIVNGISRNGDGFIAIRSGAGGKYKMIDKLYRNGEKVIVTDTRGKWKGVVYGKANCGQGLLKHRGEPYVGSCKTGWVYGKYIQGESRTNQKVVKTKKLKRKSNVKLGKKLYRKCAGCHGVTGRGKPLGKRIRLAGQSKTQIRKKLLGYKNGTRNVVGMGMLMTGQVSRMSRSKIDALADYIANFR